MALRHRADIKTIIVHKARQNYIEPILLCPVFNQHKTYSAKWWMDNHGSEGSASVLYRSGFVTT